jgi:hypothetical protein
MKILDYIKNNKAEVSYIKYVKAGEIISYTIKNELHSDCLKLKYFAGHKGYYGVFNIDVIKNCYLIFELKMSPIDYGEDCCDDYIITDVIEEE